MVIRIEDGKETYLFRKQTVTKVIFWLFFSFCIASFIAFVVMFLCGVITDTWDFLERIGGVIFAVLFLFFVPVVFEKIFKLYVPNVINIFLFTIPIFNLVIGHSWAVFYIGIGFDTLMHAYNGVIFVLLGISVVLLLNQMPIKNRQTSLTLIMFFAFCFSMFIEYLWEILEYFIDTVSPDTNMQEWKDSLVDVVDGNHIHSYYRGAAIQDTIMDMLFHAATSLITCIACFIYAKRKEFGLYQISVLSKNTVHYLTNLSGTGLEIGTPLSEINQNQQASEANSETDDMQNQNTVLVETSEQLI